METSHKIEYYFKVLSRLDQYIQLADSKATIYQAILASVLTAVTALFSWGLSIKLPNTAILSFSFSQTLMIISYIFFLMFCILWYSAITKVVNPDTSRTNENQIIDTNYVSTIFFEDIKGFNTHKEFIDRSVNLSEEQSLADLLIQIHVVSRIVSTKYDNYKKIRKWMTIAVINSLVLAIIIIQIKSEVI